MKYRNTTKGDLVTSEGHTIVPGKTHDFEPKTVVEKAWVKRGMLEAVDKAPKPAAAPAPKTEETKKTDEKKPE